VPDDPLVALALRVTDGESIDWKAEIERESVAPSLVRVLQQIDAVARAHEHDTPTETYVSTGRPEVVSRLPSGSYWGHLEIIELIGSGSYGDVYRARDTRLGRDVALKLLRASGAAESNSSSLVREGHLLSRVRHANVVTVYGADCVNGQTGLWMELIEGETLEQEVQRQGRFQAAEVAQIGAVLADALEAVHSAGLLHQDVKAQNVMRDRAGRLVLMDFGSGHDAQRFAASTVEGTPLYAAPEVLNGEEASVRSDIYSLGVLLWYLLTASYPVNGQSVKEIKRAHSLGRIAKLEDARAAGAVAGIAAECLAIDASKRPPSAGELGRRLRACSQPSGLRRRFVRNWTALGVFAAAVLLLSTAPLQLSSKAGAGSLGATGEPVWSVGAAAMLSGPPSADGRYFACVGGKFPVAICDVTTGTVRPVPITDQWREGFNARPLISPDGQRVAYHGVALEEIKIFDVPTSTFKSITVDPSLFVKVSRWRASGDSLLVVLYPIRGNGSSVALLDINTRTLTDLKQSDATLDDVELSHDGRRLAFTERGELYINDLLSGDTRHIAGASKVPGSVLWTPNDDGVLFISEGTGLERTVSELRLMRLADGRPIGEIEALRRSSGGSYISLHGISDTGDVYYYNSNGITHPHPTTLYVASFDSATQQIGAPSALALVPSRVSMDWSPDSTSIAYARSHETKTPTIVIRNAGTAVEREFELREDFVDPSVRRGPQWVDIIRWSPQKKILVRANSNDHLVSHYLVDLDEPSVRRLELPRETTFTPSSVEWAPDASTVLYASGGSVRAFDVGSGLLMESHTLPDDSPWAEVAPSQRMVAFNNKGEVYVAALDDGTPMPMLASRLVCLPVGWWKRKVFVACRDNSKGNLSPLYLVDVASGTAKAIHVNLEGIEQVRVRPDDRAVAITAAATTPGTFVFKVPRR